MGGAGGSHRERLLESGTITWLTDRSPDSGSEDDQLTLDDPEADQPTSDGAAVDRSEVGQDGI